MISRDNMSRIPVAQQQSEEQPSSPFSFPQPTQIVPLPSRGLLYSPSSTLFGKEEVEIKFMTAKEEDILTSKSLIKRGIVLDRLIESVLMDKTIKVDDLLLGDKTAILLAIRSSGYGNDYPVSLICPSCQHKFQFSFDLDELPIKFFSEDAPLSSDKTFFITLPTSKITVECRLLTSKDEKQFIKIKEVQKKFKNEDVENSSTSFVKSIVVSLSMEGVPPNHDPKTIDIFSTWIPAQDAKFLRNEYNKIIPSIETKKTVVCSECDNEFEVEMPFTAEFFWPK